MISLIVPVYNEAPILRPNLLRISQALERLGEPCEIIICEDGSTDGSRAIAREMASEKIRVLSSTKKLGRGASLGRAIREANGDIIVYMDIDLAADPRYLKPLIGEVRKGSAIATGSRLLEGSNVRGRAFLREFLSRGYNLLLRLMFRTAIRDHQCGFKAFNKSLVVPLLAEVKDPHWFWDSELLILAQKRGLKVSEIPVEWKDRKNSSVVLSLDILYMGLSALSLRTRL